MIFTLDVDGAPADDLPGGVSAQAVRLAAETGDEIASVAVGDGSGSPVRLPPAVTGRHRLRHPLLREYSPELYGAALAQLIGAVRPRAVVAPATERGNEVMAHAAARAGLPLATNCTSVGPAGTDPEPPAWRLTRMRQGGLLLEDAELTASTGLFTVVADPVAKDPADGGAPLEELAELPEKAFTPELDGIAASRLVEREAQTGGVTLTSARVVVSGGRGVGGADGFAPLEELAELLGGAVGCSRVATNNGWRPHRDQVGQTGARISPELYIACGISGATQHWVGCMAAEAILAINTDPEAPLVTRSSYAVIGDVAEVVPAVVAEIRRRAGSRPLIGAKPER